MIASIAVRAKYESEPCSKYVHGNVTFVVLETPHDELALKKGAEFLPGSISSMTRCWCCAT